jgi:hypothetical protein
MTSTMRWLILLPAGPGALVGGWLGEHLGLRAALAFAGAGALLLVAVVWRPAAASAACATCRGRDDPLQDVGAEAAARRWADSRRLPGGRRRRRAGPARADNGPPRSVTTPVDADGGKPGGSGGGRSRCRRSARSGRAAAAAPALGVHEPGSW